MKHDDLWTFALACYAEPGVEKACLELQALGMDVCLLLACVWLEIRGVQHNAQRLEELKQLSADWQSAVVLPLRNLRQAWRQQAAIDTELASLRQRVKTLELDAERTQLERLQQATQHWLREDGSNNWLNQLCTGVDGDPGALLTVLRRAASQLDAGGAG
ncbi:TIGR02444 family protein [Stutzerimonas stutzeri]|uniref:TIGR02444 family protein n=1 Tax=Stutzerimonas stutzeri TaxID=316 RepID=UPI00210E1562|nr:TIGR02444 family protein [Stutzerimonas stutzeri]MCQ4321024.1 TIGR02444 family protein [Stutzerimonas stutzeri]